MQDCWSKVLEVLHSKVDKKDMECFIKPLKYVSYIDGILSFTAPSDFPLQWFMVAYADTMMTTFFDVNGMEVKQIKINPQTRKTRKEKQEKNAAPPPQKKKKKIQAGPSPLFEVESNGGVSYSSRKIQTYKNKDFNSFSVFQLVKDFTFDNFIVGDSNRLAVAAAKHLQNYPKTDIKILYMYGITGVGKTHLAQAIGNWFLRNTPYKAIFAPSERFVNDYVCALKYGIIEEFRNFYRSADIFLLDDAQFLQGKGKSQEEIFHTYEFLRNEGKLVVFCSDRQLSDMEVEDRLISRLSQHFVVDIKPPDELTLRAIIEKKCELYGISLSAEAEDLLCSSGISSIRMIEGIIYNLKWLSKNGVEIDIPTVKETVAKIKPKMKISPEKVIRMCANVLEIPVEEIKGSSRQKNVVLARQMAMYILRLVSNRPLQDIAEIFNKKDHTTILYSIKKIKRLLKENPQYNEIFRNIMSSLDLSNGGIT